MNNFINNCFGSKKALYKRIKFHLLFSTGIYKEFASPNLSFVTRFVFVCNGNICRSALAQAIMTKNGASTISFGLDTRGNDPADPRIIAFAKEHGLDLTAHRTTRVNQYVPLPGDLLIGMEPKHLWQLQKLFPLHNVTALGLWLVQKKICIHDPYSTNPVFFNKIANQVLVATNNLYNAFTKNTIKNKAQKNSVHF